MIPDLYDRELKFGEIFKVSWKIFFRNFKYLFVFGFLLLAGLKQLDSLVISLPVIAGDTFLAHHLDGTISTTFEFIFCIVTISIAKQSVAAQQVSWGYLFWRIKKFFWAALLIHVIETLFSSLTWVPGFMFRLGGYESVLAKVFQGGLALIVAVFAVYFIFTCQTLVLRGKTGFSAFGYSFRAVKGRWWKMFGTLTLLGLTIIIPLVVIMIALKRLFAVPLTAGTQWILPVVMFMSAFGSIYFTILFLNIDREGLKEKVDELRYPVNPVKKFP